MKQELYTEYGKKTLRTRLKSLVEIYNNDNQGYPVKFRVLGFPTLILNDRTETFNRMKELSEILGVDVEVKIDVKIVGE